MKKNNLIWVAPHTKTIHGIGSKFKFNLLKTQVVSLPCLLFSLKLELDDIIILVECSCLHGCSLIFTGKVALWKSMKLTQNILLSTSTSTFSIHFLHIYNPMLNLHIIRIFIQKLLFP